MLQDLRAGTLKVEVALQYALCLFSTTNDKGSRKSGYEFVCFKSSDRLEFYFFLGHIAISKIIIIVLDFSFKNLTI